MFSHREKWMSDCLFHIQLSNQYFIFASFGNKLIERPEIIPQVWVLEGELATLN